MLKYIDKYIDSFVNTEFEIAITTRIQDCKSHKTLKVYKSK